MSQRTVLFLCYSLWPPCVWRQARRAKNLRPKHRSQRNGLWKTWFVRKTARRRSERAHGRRSVVIMRKEASASFAKLPAQKISVEVSATLAWKLSASWLVTRTCPSAKMIRISCKTLRGEMPKQPQKKQRHWKARLHDIEVMLGLLMNHFGLVFPDKQW